MAPIKTVVGLEEKQAFLSRIVSDYSAMTFMRDQLPSDAHVLMLWNGQGYYCEPLCNPDADQSRWIYLVDGESDFDTLAMNLSREGVTHLLISGEFQTIVEQDATGRQGEAIKSFYDDFVPRYTQAVYQDFWVQVYELEGPESLGVRE